MARMPRRANMSMSVSMLKRSIRPRIRSLIRGCVPPRSSAASACFNPRAVITFCRWAMNSARIYRYPASYPEKPRSRKTFPLDRVSFTLFMDHLPFRRARRLISRCRGCLTRSRSSFGGRRVRFSNACRRRWPRELRDIEHAMLGAGVNADLLHAEPHAWHRHPIVRLESTLDTPELEPRNLPDVIWGGPNRVSEISEPDQALFAQASIYEDLGPFRILCGKSWPSS